MLDQTSKLSSVVAESLRCNSVVSGIANSVDSWIGTDGTESTVGTEIGWIWEDDDDELVETWKLLICIVLTWPLSMRTRFWIFSISNTIINSIWNKIADDFVSDRINNSVTEDTKNSKSGSHRKRSREDDTHIRSFQVSTSSRKRQLT